MELRTLDQQPGDAFVFMLGNAVSAQAGGAILAVEFLAVKNFVPALAAFDGSVDELKHTPAAQRNAAKQIALSRLGRSHLRLSTVFLLWAMKKLSPLVPD